MSNLPYEAVIGTVLSLLGNAFVTVRSATQRVSALEKKFELAAKRLDTARNDLKSIISTLEEVKRGLRLELDGFRSEMDSHLRRSFSDNQPLDVAAFRELLTMFQKNTEEQLTQLQTKMRRVEAEHRQYFESRGDFVSASEFRHYSKEQQEQWTRLTRTLGQIEGMARRNQGG